MFVIKVEVLVLKIRILAKKVKLLVTDTGKLFVIKGCW